MSTIPVVCECGQTLNARSSLAGKRVKCPKCGNILTIVRPQLPTRPKPKKTAASAGGLGDLFDDIGIPEQPLSSGPKCPQCDSPVAPGAIICVQCGFNSQTGQTISSHVKQGEAVFDPSKMTEVEMRMRMAERALAEGPEEETSKDFGDGKKITSYLLTIFLPVLMVAVGAAVTIWGGGLVTWIVHIFEAIGDKKYSVAIARSLITISVLISMLGWFQVTLHALAFRVYHGVLSLFLLYFYALLFGVIDWARCKSGAAMLVTGFWIFCFGIACYMILELKEAGAIFMLIALVLIVGGGFTAWLGWFRVALDAHSENTAQGLLSLFVPFYAIVYGINTWQENKTNMIILISGSSVLLLGLLLFLIAFLTGGAPETNNWLDISKVFFTIKIELEKPSTEPTIAPI